MPKYFVFIETEKLNEEQLRTFNWAISNLALLTDKNRKPLLRRVELAESVDLRFLENHITERVR
jgi:hypothetical protein